MTVIVGDNTAETLTGSSGADSITANGGADTILADDGADTIRGGDGVDSIDSGLGDDRIYESTFFDSDTIFGGVILGGDGNDTITAGHITASLSIDGGSGNDTLHIFDTSSNLASVTGIETIIYESFSYQTITLADGNVGAGQTLTVMAGDLYNLNAGLTLNGSAELDGFLHISTLDHEISTLFGTADSIVGGAQADVINTFLGDDTIKGGLGDDTINGGTGTDTVVYSGNSADYIVTTSGLAVIVGGPDGVDTLYNVNRLKFADGVVVAVVPGQSLVGDGLSNTLNGGEGADTILGLGAADVLNGGDANDSIDAGAGEDSAVGGSGADTILGGEGNDTLRGGNGVDSVDGGTGNDLIYESDFFDSDNVFGGVIQGGAGDDTIWAGHIVPQGLGWLSVDGGLGNDVLHIVDSASNLTHVTGIETIVYESFSFQSITLTDINVGAAQTLTIVAGQLNNLNAGVTINGSAELDGFLNISTLDHSISGLFGTADTVTGGAQSDLIRTYLGADVLNGGGGDDILEGGADNDTLNGD
ncbi:MAG: calcium-binding protein, partial [Caulobacteraceae bacterium]